MVPDSDAYPLAAQALLEAEGLPFPPVPPRWEHALERHACGVFTTRQLPETPYNLGYFLAEFERVSGPPDYAIVGFAGHGVNSWALHYYLVEGALALFVQLPWGGAYLEPDAARADITDIFDWAGRVQVLVRTARERGKLPDGWRLVVVASRFGRAGWCWMVPGAHAGDAPWRSAASMKARIEQCLEDILAGRATPQEQMQNDESDEAEDRDEH